MTSTAPAPSTASLLPFSLVSYDGSHSTEDDDNPIENVLSDDSDLFHCSRQGHNFNLVLRYSPTADDATASCALTHLVISGPATCTAPIATGVVFTSLTPPDVSAYTAKYDDLTQAQFDALPTDDRQRNGALAYFTVTNLTTLQIPITLPHPVECRYLHVKFLSSHPRLSAADRDERDDNIDVARIAVVGYPTAHPPAADTSDPDLLLSLGLIAPELGRWNPLSESFVSTLNSAACCLLFSGRASDPVTEVSRSVLRGIAESGDYETSLHFFNHDDSSREASFACAGAILAGGDVSWVDGDGKPSNSARLPVDAHFLAIVDADGEDSVPYRYAGLMEDQAVRAWLDQFVAGSLKPFVRSQPRPANDEDPRHLGVLQVTAATFDELVMRSEKNVYLVMVNEARPDHQLASAFIRCWMYALADTIQHPDLVYAVFDMERNQQPEVLPLAVPESFLFLKGSKDEPIHLRAPLTEVDALPRLVCEQLPSLDVDFDAISTSPPFAHAAEYSQLFMAMFSMGDTFNAALIVSQHVAAKEDMDSLLEVRDETKRWARLLAASGKIEPQLKSGLETAMKAYTTECRKWRPLMIDMQLSSTMLGMIQSEMSGGAESALSEDERKGLKAALAELTKMAERVGYGDENEPRVNQLDWGDEEESDEGAEDMDAKDDEADDASSALAADGQPGVEGQGEVAEAAPSTASTEPADPPRKEEQWDEASGEPKSSFDYRQKSFPVRTAAFKAYCAVRSKLEAKRNELAVAADGRVVTCQAADDFTAVLDKAKADRQLVVVDFTAAWCGPCKRARPVFGSLSQQYDDVVFVRVDVDDCEEVARQYEISAMPTFVFIRGGDEVAERRVQGADLRAVAANVLLLSKRAEEQVQVA